jgi:hypothetical protein
MDVRGGFEWGYVNETLEPEAQSPDGPRDRNAAMDDAFDPETIHAGLWTLVESTSSDDEVAEALATLPKKKFVALFKAYIEARTELVDTLQGEPWRVAASEDTLDDLAEGIICLGRKAYLDVYRGETPPPPRETWEELRTLAAFAEVYEERFDGDVFDELDD